LGKVLAYDVVILRVDRSGESEYLPMEISISKSIVQAMKLKKGDRLRIFTDGSRIYVDKEQESEI
jgi:hypothetical protein